MRTDRQPRARSAATPPNRSPTPRTSPPRTTTFAGRAWSTSVGTLEVASQLGAPQMLACLGWGYLDEPVEAAWERSVASMAAIDQRAQEYGIRLAYEPSSPRRPTWSPTCPVPSGC